jgi:hypothetical protein
MSRLPFGELSTFLEKLRTYDEQGDRRSSTTRDALMLALLTWVRTKELRFAVKSEFENLDGTEPLWRIPAARMKGALDRKEELRGDHLVPLPYQAVAVLRAIWPLSGNLDLVFPSARHSHRPMSENALGYLLNRAGYHGHHVPHGFRAAFSTIMNEWAERHGKDHDRQVIDLMLAHLPKGKVEGAYNRAGYMPRRRELAIVWADLVSDGLPAPVTLLDLPARETGPTSRRRVPRPVGETFRFPRDRAKS